MQPISVRRIVQAAGSPSDCTIKLTVELQDGSQTTLVMDWPTTQSLATTAHQAMTKLADQMRSGPLREAGGMVQVQLFDCQTVHVGHDLPTKTAAVIFDHGLTSQAGYRLPEKQFWQLAQGLTNTMSVLFGKSPQNKH